MLLIEICLLLLTVLSTPQTMFRRDRKPDVGEPVLDCVLNLAEMLAVVVPEAVLMDVVTTAKIVAVLLASQHALEHVKRLAELTVPESVITLAPHVKVNVQELVVVVLAVPVALVVVQIRVLSDVLGIVKALVIGLVKEIAMGGAILGAKVFAAHVLRHV